MNPGWLLFIKGMCYVLIGVFTPWSAAMAQWIGSGEWPGRIIWVAVILPASVLGGAGQLLAFLNSDFAKHQQASIENKP